MLILIIFRVPSRLAIGVADDHSLSVRRFAQVIKWLQGTVAHASTLAIRPLLICNAVR